MKSHIKFYFFSFFLLLVFSTSCNLQDAICKKGKGDIVSQERNVSSFTTVESKGSFNVNIFQDSSIKTQQITILAQENIIDLIQTRISGQSLIIDSDECYTTNEEITIIIRTPALSQIVLAGSGNIILEDRVQKNELEIILNGSGNIRTTSNFPISSTNFTTKLKGSGTIELDFDQTNNINASVSGSGNIILRGKAQSNNLKITGSGNIKAFSLSVLTSTAEITGSGSIELLATDSRNPSKAIVKAKISGSGNISIKGNANIESNVSGSGKVKRLN